MLPLTLTPRNQFDALEGRVIHATQYWTETNIADGLNALAICIEMVIFSAFMMYAYSWKEYTKVKGATRYGAGRALWDSINYCTSHCTHHSVACSHTCPTADFAHEIAGSIKFFIDYARGKPGTHGPRIPVTDEMGKQTKMDFGQAFGLHPRPDTRGSSNGYASSTSSQMQMQAQRVNTGLSAPRAGPGESMSMSAVRAPRASYDENVRLAPYSYEGGAQSTTTTSSSSGGHGVYNANSEAGMAGVGLRGAGGPGFGYGAGAYSSARPSGDSEYGVAR